MRWLVVYLAWLAVFCLCCSCGRPVGSNVDASSPDASAPDASTPDASVAVCNWEELYAVAIYGASPPPGMLRCPAGTNCIPGDQLDAGCSLVQGEDACRSVSDGYTCSLVTGQLLVDPARTCSDLDPTQGCSLFDNTGPVPMIAGGSLIGFCQYLPMGPVTRDLWENCNYISELCVPGSTCIPWGGLDEGWGSCVPMCDTEDPAGLLEHCEATGGPTGSECRSISRQCDPAPPPPHVRLGFCE